MADTHSHGHSHGPQEQRKKNALQRMFAGLSSKSSKIIILLAIDSVFFLIELCVGYSVHSLALVADSFHMLNDVLSLVVGLWAVKAANRTQTAKDLKMYTYGYQRAETLGALVNGVFLVALCVTIFLDAIQRFVEPQEVKNPQIVLIVGCLGLASNLVGLLLFHDHSHGPGGHSHGGHSHGNEVRDAEEGHAGHSHDHSGALESYRDDPEEEHEHDHAHGDAHTATSESTAVADESSKMLPSSAKRHSRTGSKGVQTIGSYEEYSGPAGFRNQIIATAAAMDTLDSDEGTDGENIIDEDEPGTASDALLSSGKSADYGTSQKRHSVHREHKHRQPKEAGKGGGHSHGDLNMKGIFLHVMGDALGNIGVIATALIIWLTDFKARFYCDPAISLVITFIILCSAIPLCKAASRILLQAVPPGIEVDDIKEDIEALAGIESCHHLHVWQLSDTKLIASLHVRVNFNFKGEGSQRYMGLASNIRECLHEYGIHNATIQPEFHPDQSNVEDDDNGRDVPQESPRNGSVVGDNRCLLDCDDNCGGGKSCCPPSQPQESQEHEDHDHDDHDHDHDHVH